MKKIIPIDIIKGFSDKFCGSNSKENFATNKCSSAYFTYRSPFVLRSFSVRSPFVLRSSSVHPPFALRSISVRAPFGDRRTNGESSKKYRRIIGGKTEMYRNSNEKPRERRPNKNFIFNHLNSNCYGKI